jgi:hypothetical protein
MGNLYNKTVTINKNTNTVRTKVHGDHIVFRDDFDVSTNVRGRCFDECAACFSSQTYAFGPRAFAFRLGTTNHRHANNTSLTLCSKQRKENQLAMRNISYQSCVQSAISPNFPSREFFDDMLQRSFIFHSFVSYHGFTLASNLERCYNDSDE